MLAGFKKMNVNRCVYFLGLRDTLQFTQNKSCFGMFYDSALDMTHHGRSGNRGV